MKKKVTILSIIFGIILTLIFLIGNSIISIGKIINTFIKCEQNITTNFSCYFIYDIYSVIFLLVLFILTLILIIIELCKHKHIRVKLKKKNDRKNK